MTLADELADVEARVARGAARCAEIQAEVAVLGVKFRAAQLASNADVWDAGLMLESRRLCGLYNGALNRLGVEFETMSALAVTRDRLMDAWNVQTYAVWAHIEVTP